MRVVANSIIRKAKYFTRPFKALKFQLYRVHCVESVKT